MHRPCHCQYVMTHTAIVNKIHFKFKHFFTITCTMSLALAAVESKQNAERVKAKAMGWVQSACPVLSSEESSCGISFAAVCTYWPGNFLFLRTGLAGHFSVTAKQSSRV